VLFWLVAPAREDWTVWEGGAWPALRNASNGLVSPDGRAPACGLVARASAETGGTRSVGTVDTENLSDGTGLQPLEQILGHSREKGTYEIPMS
jgi:hypothetical protein